MQEVKVGVDFGEGCHGWVSRMPPFSGRSNWAVWGFISCDWKRWRRNRLEAGEFKRLAFDKMTFEVLVRYSGWDVEEPGECMDLNSQSSADGWCSTSWKRRLLPRKGFWRAGCSPLQRSHVDISGRTFYTLPFTSWNKICRSNDQPTHIISKRNHLVLWL